MPLDQLTQHMPQAGKKLNAKSSSRGKKDEILINPKDEEDKVYVKESQDSTAVMTFGRFNPPTVGHEKLIHKVNDVAKEHDGSAHVFASHSEGTSKDPLPQKHKLGYLKKVAPEGVSVHGSSKEAPNFLHAAKKLSDAGHKHLVMVAGSDRVDEYKRVLNKYNGQEGHHSFKSIKVVSSGERDPDAEGVAGMSGTKMRAHARAGENEKFKAGLPKALHPHSQEIINHIKSVKEDFNTAFETFVEQLAHESRAHKLVATALGNLDRWKNVSFDQPRPKIKDKKEPKKQDKKSLSYEQFNQIADIVESNTISESAETSLKFKAFKAGISYDVIKEVYERGLADWNVDQTKQTAHQWAFARVNSFISNGKAADLDSDLSEACWKGYKAIGTKKKGGKDVPNCVPTNEETFTARMSYRQWLAKNKQQPSPENTEKYKKEMTRKEEVEQVEEAKTPAWQRKAGKSEEGGLNKKGIASYRKENPGSKLSMAVTTKPSKLDPDSKSAKRRKSFCARMSGMKKKLTSAETAKDPDSRINKALRKWNC